MRCLLLLLVWGTLALSACGGGDVKIVDGCRQACCGCGSDADCDDPRRCWPLTINDVTHYVCMASNEICVPSSSKPLGTPGIMRLSFLPRYRSAVLDFSRGESAAATPAPVEGDVALTAEGRLDGAFARSEAFGPVAQAGVVDLGPIQSLSQVPEAPVDGYVPSTPVVLGHGYAVRCQEGTYARCRVKEPIVEADGTLSGWLLEWTYQGDGTRTF